MNAITLELNGHRGVARFRPLTRRLLLLLVAGLLIQCTSQVLLAREAVFSARVLANAGVEVEGHFGPVGVLVSFVPEFHIDSLRTFGGKTCEEKYDRTFYGGRFFIDGVQDSWYFGAALYTEERTTDGSCLSKALSDAESGAFPLVGFHWLWESGFNLDLGLRPGILALGFSF